MALLVIPISVHLRILKVVSLLPMSAIRRSKQPSGLLSRFTRIDIKRRLVMTSIRVRCVSTDES